MVNLVDSLNEESEYITCFLVDPLYLTHCNSFNVILYMNSITCMEDDELTKQT